MLNSKFHKLIFIDNKYSINSKKKFNGEYRIQQDDLKECLKFAWRMTWGELGEHRNHRSGGIHQRQKSEIFCDTFEGKFGEFIFYRKMLPKFKNLKEPDITTSSLGSWDNYDFSVNGKLINIKTTKFFGNLLLLEQKDYADNFFI